MTNKDNCARSVHKTLNDNFIKFKNHMDTNNNRPSIKSKDVESKQLAHQQKYYKNNMMYFNLR